MKQVKNDLFDYENRYIYQLNKGFKFSLDSILLAEYVNLKNKFNLIVDFGTGNAPIPLILSTKSGVKIVGIEIQKKIYDLALKSVNFNNLDEQITIINDDINNVLKYINYEEADVVICNPPYFVKKSDKVLNNDITKKIARHEMQCTLEDVFKNAYKILKGRGYLYLSNRTSRLDDIIVLGRKYNINVKEVLFIDTKGNLNPEMLLIKCIKGSKSGLKIKYKNVKSLESYQNIFEED